MRSTTRAQKPVRRPEADERDPEDRSVEPTDRDAVREKMLDKTIADSFPASDPASTIPDPESDSF